jgi:hypothetical protein
MLMLLVISLLVAQSSGLVANSILPKLQPRRHFEGQRSVLRELAKLWMGHGYDLGLSSGLGCQPQREIRSVE